MENQERHYNINKLNIIFALSSVALLLAVVWMLMDDYGRTWKDYQKEFRMLEIEKTRVKYDAEDNTLKEQGEYAELQAEVGKAQKDYETSCSGMENVKDEIRELRAENDLLKQEQKFTNAKLDAARYRYEANKARAADRLEESRGEYERLKKGAEKLRVDVEESDGKLSAKTQIIDNCGAQLKSLERKKQELSRKLSVLELKLSKIDPNQMDFTNRIADMARDLPILDLANPNYKIKQIVLKDITDDVNFMHVAKVDRCITCHLGIDNPDFADADQPFKTHPKLDVFIGRDSPHPMEEVGCTVCHNGRGRGTDFISAAHSPSSAEQAKEWEEKYGWEAFHFWEKPMLPLPYTEASCLKCHTNETSVKGAEKLNLGLHIVEKAGCYRCHVIDRFKGWPKPGPNLTKVAGKVNKDWAYRWIRDPKSFRHNTWMPSFFNQSNNSDAESQKRVEQEIHAIVHRLFSGSEDFEKKPIPVTGDSGRGQELVAFIGCMGCHQIKPQADNEPTTAQSLRTEHGPNFIGLGSKTSAQWIYNWIKDPVRYHPGTKMPNLRLTDQEAADIATYLSSLTDDDFSKIIVPPVNNLIINDIVGGFLSKTMAQQETQDRLSQMNLDDKMDYAGGKLIRHYGCFACHDIKGFEHDKPIGTELTEEGDKSVHKLDYGFIDIDHTNYAWFTQKLKEPRIFDKGRIKAPDEKLRMPNFHFTDREIEAVVTVLLGLVRDRPEAKIVPRDTKNIQIEEGQKIVRQMNCQGCHILENEGGAIQPSVKDWLMTYDNHSDTEAAAITTIFSPPNLVGEGRKVRSQWLFDFLHGPTTIRPWLKVRMPTFNFNAEELNIMLKYFAALDDQEFPFAEKVDVSLTDKEYAAAEKLFSADYFDCAKCHIVGNQLPGGSPANWAPNFALAKERLRPGWIIDWIIDPQNLLPGTKMPNYFDPQAFDISGPDDILDGDEHAQIRVLRNYLLTLSERPPKKPAAQPVEPAPIPAMPQPGPAAETD